MLTLLKPDFTKGQTAKYQVQSSDITGGADTISIVLTNNTHFTHFAGDVIVETSSGVRKITNLTVVYTGSTGTLTITDATTEFVNGDLITLVNYIFY